MEKRGTPYWLEAGIIPGKNFSNLKDGGVAIIGSGVSGVSVAYWLLENGMTDCTILDFEPEKAATFRNCGHILLGTVESMSALVALYGKEKAEELWRFSIELCEQVGETQARLQIPCEYRKEGYLVIAMEESELKEIHHAIDLLHSMDIKSDFVSSEKLATLGFKNVLGARFDPGCASAHPVKFRNGVLQNCLDRGVNYITGAQVTHLRESADSVEVTINGKKFHFDALVIASNAYSPLYSDFFKSRRLVEPFKGQIITSKPLKHPLKVTYPHSFDHGYEYALGTQDGRLMIGGWRNHVPGGEIGSYSLDCNVDVEKGLQEFVKEHYSLKEEVEWEYSWAGIMAASASGLPFIGPVGTRIFTCSGYTGHGFSWAHGSAKLLSQIMCGEGYLPVAKYFNPSVRI